MTAVILDSALRQVEDARNELNKAAHQADGWADSQRREFDAQRMKPLDDAGKQLQTALRKLQEQCVSAERLLAE